MADGLDPNLQAAFNALAADAPGRVWITSGWRSNQKQTQLWEAALQKYGDPEVADNWVARPGSSNHEKGAALDLGFENAQVREWVHANAGRYGMRFPMAHEPWHIELAGQRNLSDRAAYTNNPNTGANPLDELEQEDPHDPGVQSRRLFELIQVGGQSTAGNAPEPEFTGDPTMHQELVTPS